ncbi:50S ribosomal protein L16 [Patescibacteria group bacterium]|nr:50S ribosomal protein L16 [Patescibacteria group bacterium]MBU2633403.1 50S ribosomal protein L16 [Patescibacteria group bacterium]
MLFPKKVKYRKWHRMRVNPKKKQVATRGAVVSFGGYGMKAEQPGEITSNQIEAVRRVLTRSVQKTGKVWIRIFPDRPVTKKPPETGMGKGRGDPVGFVASVKSGRILFELDGVSKEVAKSAIKKASSKLPVKTKFVLREI